MITFSSILAWEIPWTEEPSSLQSMGSQRLRHNLATKQQPKMGIKETPWQNWCIKRCPKQPRYHQYEDKCGPANTDVRLTLSTHLPLQGAPHPAHAHARTCTRTRTHARTHAHTHTHARVSNRTHVHCLLQPLKGHFIGIIWFHSHSSPMRQVFLIPLLCRRGNEGQN